MAHVIVSVGAAPSLLQRQTWLSAIQGLNLALFINTQDQAFFWRIQIKPNHIGQLFQKIDVPRALETISPVRLQIVFLPDAVDGVLADVLGTRHRPAAPVSRSFWLGLQGGPDDRGYLSLVVEGLATASGTNLPNRLQPIRFKAFAPQRGCVPVDVQFRGDFQVLFALPGH